MEEEKLSLFPELKKLLSLLNQHGVEYLLIGGYAVNFYGYYRNTGDVDIWVSRSEDNKKKLANAIDEFGYDVEQLLSKNFTSEQVVFHLGVPPERIEFLNHISGAEFSKAYPERSTMRTEGLEIPVIGLRDLKSNKRRAGRYKDLDDLEHLPE